MFINPLKEVVHAILFFYFLSTFQCNFLLYVSVFVSDMCVYISIYAERGRKKVNSAFSNDFIDL